jgi:hypothetical protein
LPTTTEEGRKTKGMKNSQQTKEEGRKTKEEENITKEERKKRRKNERFTREGAENENGGYFGLRFIFVFFYFLNL